MKYRNTAKSIKSTETIQCSRNTEKSDRSTEMLKNCRLENWPGVLRDQKRISTFEEVLIISLWFWNIKIARGVRTSVENESVVLKMINCRTEICPSILKHRKLVSSFIVLKMG